MRKYLKITRMCKLNPNEEVYRRMELTYCIEKPWNVEDYNVIT